MLKSSPHGVEDIDTENHAVVLNHIQYFVTEVSMLNEPILQCCNPVFLYPVKYVKSTNRPSIPLRCITNTFPASTLVAKTTIYNVEVKSKCNDRKAPLHIASEEGCVAVVQALLENNNVEVNGNGKKSPK